MSRIRRIKKVEDIIALTSFINLPPTSISYFYDCECYGIYINDKIKAGYILKHTDLVDMITIQKIPKKQRGHLLHEDPFNYVEVVGYFADDIKLLRKLCIHLAITLLRHKASYIVYSYLTEDTKTEAILRYGFPLRLYSGKPYNYNYSNLFLPVSINIEMISKISIIRICIYLCIGKIKRLFR